jgi:hypothetical protein
MHVSHEYVHITVMVVTYISKPVISPVFVFRELNLPQVAEALSGVQDT